jgi:hypothetical protein
LRRRILGIRFAAKKSCDDLFFQPLRLGGIGRFDHSLFVLREFFATPLKLLFEFMDEFQDATLFSGRQILDFVDNRSGIHIITLPFDFHKGKAALIGASCGRKACGLAEKVRFGPAEIQALTTKRRPHEREARRFAAGGKRVESAALV